MIATLMVVTAIAGSSPLGTARHNYAACLTAFRQEAEQKKMPLADYKAALQPKCADQETAFRAAVTASEKADGISAKEAGQDAADQVQQYLDDAVDGYEDAPPEPAAPAPPPSG